MTCIKCKKDEDNVNGIIYECEKCIKGECSFFQCYDCEDKCGFCCGNCNKWNCSEECGGVYHSCMREDCRNISCEECFNEWVVCIECEEMFCEDCIPSYHQNYYDQKKGICKSCEEYKKDDYHYDPIQMTGEKLEKWTKYVNSKTDEDIYRFISDLRKLIIKKNKKN